jgi:hypothetical protein
VIIVRVLMAGVFLFIGIGAVRTSFVGLKGLRDGRTPSPGSHNDLTGHIVEGWRGRALGLFYFVGGAWIVFLSGMVIHSAALSSGDC